MDTYDHDALNALLDELEFPEYDMGVLAEYTEAFRLDDDDEEYAQ